MSKLRKGMMKLSKPIVFKNIFNIFDDNRGFLSTLDIQKLLNKIPDSKFNFAYQLLSFSEKKHTFRGMHYQEKPFAQNKLTEVNIPSSVTLIGYRAFDENVRIIFNLS